MEIIGYSERGAMNALFYEMALKNDEKGMQDFLFLAGVNNPTLYNDFKLYTEFSLSEFGSPDLVIKAKIGDKHAVFFVEAKASCCKNYKLDDQKIRHIEYVKSGTYDDGHASNLFFQLRLKNYFFQLIKYFNGKTTIRPHIEYEDDVDKRITDSRGREREIGKNRIVREFVQKFDGDEEAYYIAIIPEQSEEKIEPDESFGFPIHFITWKQIQAKFSGYTLLPNTIVKNQVSEDAITISQILNNPK